MPQNFIDDRLDSATGEVVITLKYPDIIPIMSSCEVAETRRAVTVARECAYGNNLEHVARGVTLRKETAALLGYPSWAHYVTETRMSGSPEAVHGFMEQITELAQAGSKACLEELRQAKIKHMQKRGELKYGDDEAEVRIHRETGARDRGLHPRLRARLRPRYRPDLHPRPDPHYRPDPHHRPGPPSR